MGTGKLTIGKVHVTYCTIIRGMLFVESCFSACVSFCVLALHVIVHGMFFVKLTFCFPASVLCCIVSLHVVVHGVLFVRFFFPIFILAFLIAHVPPVFSICMVRFSFKYEFNVCDINDVTVHITAAIVLQPTGLSLPRSISV